MIHVLCLALETETCLLCPKYQAVNLRFVYIRGSTVVAVRKAITVFAHTLRFNTYAYTFIHII